MFYKINVEVQLYICLFTPTKRPDTVTAKQKCNPVSICTDNRDKNVSPEFELVTADTISSRSVRTSYYASPLHLHYDEAQTSEKENVKRFRDIVTYV